MSALRFTLLLAVLSSAAAAQSDEIRKYLQTAITLYENLDYEKALKQLKHARTRATGADDEAKLSLLEGVILADMGKEERALTAFKTGFSVDVEAKLPVEVSPKVQAIAEKARANVRKMLAPQLEAARVAEEERRRADELRQAEEKRRADEEAARVAEQQRRQDQEKAAGRVVQPAPTAPSARSLAWIPGAVGLISAGVGTGFLVSASTKHEALINGTVSPELATTYRDTGKSDATLGYVFAGVGGAGVVAAVVMLIAGAPASAPTVMLVPSADGAFVSIGGRFE